MRVTNFYNKSVFTQRLDLLDFFKKFDQDIPSTSSVIYHSVPFLQKFLLQS